MGCNGESGLWFFYYFIFILIKKYYVWFYGLFCLFCRCGVNELDLKRVYES